jgi:hypothetical protein
MSFDSCDLLLDSACFCHEQGTAEVARAGSCNPIGQLVGHGVPLLLAHKLKDARDLASVTDTWQASNNQKKANKNKQKTIVLVRQTKLDVSNIGKTKSLRMRETNKQASKQASRRVFAFFVSMYLMNNSLVPYLFNCWSSDANTETTAAKRSNHLQIAHTHHTKQMRI